MLSTKLVLVALYTTVVLASPVLQLTAAKQARAELAERNMELPVQPLNVFRRQSEAQWEAEMKALNAMQAAAAEAELAQKMNNAAWKAASGAAGGQIQRSVQNLDRATAVPMAMEGRQDMNTLSAALSIMQAAEEAAEVAQAQAQAEETLLAEQLASGQRSGKV